MYTILRESTTDVAILFQRLSTGVAVAITGQWKPSPAGKEQTHELHAEEVQILGQHDVLVCDSHLQPSNGTLSVLRLTAQLRHILCRRSIIHPNS